MPKPLISPLIIIGLLSPIATKAEVYNALCPEINSSLSQDDSTIVVSNCRITISKEGLQGPNDFIPKDKISQWYVVR